MGCTMKSHQYMAKKSETSKCFQSLFLHYSLILANYNIAKRAMQWTIKQFGKWKAQIARHNAAKRTNVSGQKKLSKLLKPDADSKAAIDAENQEVGDLLAATIFDMSIFCFLEQET